MHVTNIDKMDIQDPGWLDKVQGTSPVSDVQGHPPKLKGTVYAACIRTSMTYESETLVLMSNHKQMLERAEAWMVQWMTGTTLQDRQSTEEIRKNLGLDSIKGHCNAPLLRTEGLIGTCKHKKIQRSLK